MGRVWNVAMHAALITTRLFEPAQSNELCPAGPIMNDIIYIVGLIVVVMFILSALGLR
jgi:hypothetical protein